VVPQQGQSRLRPTRGGQREGLAGADYDGKAKKGGIER
jgi:hypothetical protein